MRDAYAPIGAGRYMMKGINPAYAACFGIRHEPQGIVYGKRSGTSTNLGATAKKKLRGTGKYPPAKRWKPVPFKQGLRRSRQLQ